MNNKQKIVIGTWFAAAMVAFPAAQGAATTNSYSNNLHGLYIGIEGGIARALSTDIEPDWSNSGAHTWIPINGSYDTNLGTAASFGVKLGFAATENIKFDLSYNYRGNFNKQVAFPPPPSVVTDTPDGESYKFSNINSQALMLNVNLFPFTNLNKFKPFVSAGIGVARNKFGDMRNYDLVGPAGTPAVFDNTLQGDTKTSCTWQLGAGLDYALTEHLDLGLAYRFVDLGNFTSTKNVYEKFSKITVTAQPYVIKNLGANEFYLRLNYIF